VAVGFEPLAFCRGCHAPSADPSKATPAAAESLGIGCIHCHDASRAEGGHAAHGRVTTKGCKSCHEFAFPDDSTKLMQSTHVEHDASGLSAVACESCHMPRSDDGHLNHGFIVSRNEEMLKRAADIRIARAGDAKVAVRIVTRGVGHAFPTGDLFRRLKVTATAYDASGRATHERRRYLGRHFAQQMSASGVATRVDVKDDRPGARDASECFEIDLGTKARGQAFTAEVAYERVDHPRSADEDDAVVSQHTVLYTRTLDANSPEEPCPR
jgi:hypothetical protein